MPPPNARAGSRRFQPGLQSCAPASARGDTPAPRAASGSLPTALTIDRSCPVRRTCGYRPDAFPHCWIFQCFADSLNRRIVAVACLALLRLFLVPSRWIPLIAHPTTFHTPPVAPRSPKLVGTMCGCRSGPAAEWSHSFGIFHYRVERYIA
jgi:hypothetical protein